MSSNVGAPESQTEFVSCHACGSPVFDDESFCEACGTKVASDVPSHVPEVRSATQRSEYDLGGLAAVTDLGYKRARNEDAAALADLDGVFVVAVCDGVASTANGDRAARTAADTVLASAESASASVRSRDAADLEGLLGRAFGEAQRAVLQVPADDDPFGNDASPSTTLVAAIASPGRAVIGNVGDSRAYWLTTPRARCALLTVDDCWALDRIAEGKPPQEAYAHPDADVLTRWIGGETESWAPTVSVFEVDEPGLLVLCTDGMWGSFEEPARLAALVPDGAPSPLEVARALADAALGAGGRDNITVAVIALDGGPRHAAGRAGEELRHG